ncbi:MAG: cupin domain-containing protein [Candidatus Tritonobacter lacicola]|nr:cupin domain-containing protein [Candidatus Tritonobacter lacicola]
MKRAIVSLFVVTVLTAAPCIGAEGGKMENANVLQEIPYQDEGFGKRKLVDTNELLLMQAALKPGQKVPPHMANSNVHLLVLAGEIIVDIAGEKVSAGKGDLVPVAFGTPMYVENQGKGDATFLIIKTPHPKLMKRKKATAEGGRI